MLRTGLTLSLVCSIMPSISQAADYTFQEFTIPGKPNVMITAINDFGVATGNYRLRGSDYGAFKGRPGETVTLPLLGPETNSPRNVAFPTGINDDGVVVGTYSSDSGSLNFARESGKYYMLGNTGQNYPQAKPFISSGSYLTCNTTNQGGAQNNAYAGTIASEKLLSNSYSAVLSINREGFAAGQLINASLAAAGAFYVNVNSPNPVLHAVIPPNAVTVYGGYINDSGQIAGSYRDAANAGHGFIYHLGRYTVFDVPDSPNGPVVDGIDDNGRVVGTYQNPDGTQHGFIYFQGKIAIVGTFSSDSGIAMTISTFGHYIALSDDLYPTVRSWTGTCPAGSAC